MSTSSSVWLGTSVCTPGYRTTGRRFTHWSSSNRIRSSRSRSSTPGLHARIAHRPEEDRVARAERRELLVGEHFAGAEVPVGAEIEVDELDLEAVADGVEHPESLADDLGARAVAPDHADPVGSCHGVTSLVCAASFAWTWSARLTAAR